MMITKKAQVFRHIVKNLCFCSPWKHPYIFFSLFIFEHWLFPICVILWEYTILLGPSVIICGILRTTKVGYTTPHRTLECNLIDFYLVYCLGVAVNESIEPRLLSRVNQKQDESVLMICLRVSGSQAGSKKPADPQI